jgi:hypothetical protein
MAGLALHGQKCEAAKIVPSPPPSKTALAAEISFF